MKSRKNWNTGHFLWLQTWTFALCHSTKLNKGIVISGRCITVSLFDFILWWNAHVWYHRKRPVFQVFVLFKLVIKCEAKFQRLIYIKDAAILNIQIKSGNSLKRLLKQLKIFMMLQAPSRYSFFLNLIFFIYLCIYIYLYI